MTPRFLVGAQAMPLTEMKMTGRRASLGAVMGSVWDGLFFLSLYFPSFLKNTKLLELEGPQRSVQPTSTFDRPPAWSTVSCSRVFFVFVFFQTAFKNRHCPNSVQDLLLFSFSALCVHDSLYSYIFSFIGGNPKAFCSHPSNLISNYWPYNSHGWPTSTRTTTYPHVNSSPFP